MPAREYKLNLIAWTLEARNVHVQPILYSNRDKQPLAAKINTSELRRF